MIKSISELNCIPPSEYTKIFYNACKDYGAKYVCRNENCRHTEEWDGKEYEAEHCNRKDNCCNGLMVLKING